MESFDAEDNYTGTDPKTKSESFRRFHGSVAALPGVRLGDWEFAAGAAAELYSDYEGTCAPAGGIVYRPDEDSRLALSYREGTRQPSYTELTYDSPDSKGTIDLPLQRTRSVNLDGSLERVGDVRRARVGVFLMQSEDLVDWLKRDRSSAWKATALDPVTSFGFSGDAEWTATKALSLIPRGALVIKQTSTDQWASRYAMDFPIAAFSLEASYHVTELWRVSYRQGVAVWKSNPVRRGGVRAESLAVRDDGKSAFPPRARADVGGFRPLQSGLRGLSGAEGAWLFRLPRRNLPLVSQTQMANEGTN